MKSSIFATEVVRQKFYFEGEEVSMDLLQNIYNESHPFSGSAWKTLDQLKALPGLKVRAEVFLEAAYHPYYSGPSREIFTHEEEGYAFFMKEFGDRPLRWEWKFLVRRRKGNLIVLEPQSAQRRDYYGRSVDGRWEPVEKWRVTQWTAMPQSPGLHFGNLCFW